MLLVTMFISLVFQRGNVFFYDYLFPLNKKKRKKRKRKKREQNREIRKIKLEHQKVLPTTSIKGF